MGLVVGWTYDEVVQIGVGKILYHVLPDWQQSGLGLNYFLISKDPTG